MNDRIRALAPFLLDLVLSIGGYLLLRNAFGMSAAWALGISGGATGVNAVITTLRRRKVDTLGVLIFLEVTLSVVLLVVTKDPRVILCKPAFYVALGGLYALGTLFTRKPLAYETGKPFATRGNPALVAGYERSWEISVPFRHAIRTVTAAWGVAFLAEAVARVVIVYSFPARQIDESVLLSQAPSVLLVVAVIVFTRLRMRPLRPVIRANSPQRAEGCP